MDKPIEHFTRGRLKQAAKALEYNGFEVYVVKDAGAARELVADGLVPGLMEGAKDPSASFGGSMTLVHTGIYEAVKAVPGLDVIDTFDRSVPRYESVDMRRRALTCDIYLTSTNALTMDGKLVNLDGTGNRVAAMAFGPKNVIIVTGANKLCQDVDSAMRRVKEYAAPVNSMRLDRKTPCVKTLKCEDCSSPERICNSWLITEKSMPKGRIKVVLLEESWGF
jgi:hypothetical protein